VTRSTALTKEIRALLPTCAAIIAALFFSSGAPDLLRVQLVLLVLVCGSITLGGLAFGHEYTWRTLTLLLAQPIDRRRTCAAKFAVLVTMVALVCLAAVLAAPGRPLQMFNGRSEARAILILAPLCAICLAPALSILCRSALAGVVFTVAIPGLLMLTGNIIATLRYGLGQTEAINAFISQFVWWSVSAACATGAIATWVLFMRLQAIEGHADLQWPDWLRGDSRQLPVSRKVRGPLAALVRKELRLQQLTFVVVGLFLLTSTALWMLTRVNPEFWKVAIEPIAVLYGGLLLLLIGSVASAEERQLGTLPSQLLLPIAARTQWAVKVATTFVLALVLGVALPALVTFLFTLSEENPGWHPRRLKETLAAAALLTSGSLYVSSLSSSAVRAMVNSIPAVIAGVVFVGTSRALVMSIGYRVIAGPYGQNRVVNRELLRSFEASTGALHVWLAVLVAAAFLCFAFTNHRSMDRRVPRVVLQVLALVITAACCVTFPLFLYAR
jgi:hypothetical protein